MFRIEADPQLCSGFGSCAELAPAVFQLDRSGVVSLLVDESDDPAVVEAANSCPMGAITVFELAVESG